MPGDGCGGFGLGYCFDGVVEEDFETLVTIAMFLTDLGESVLSDPIILRYGGRGAVGGGVTLRCKDRGYRFLSRSNHYLRGLCRQSFACALGRLWCLGRWLRRGCRLCRALRYRVDCIHMLEGYQEYVVPTSVTFQRGVNSFED